MADPNAKDIQKSQMKRDSDSVDDFEHLGHDSSPLKEQNTADDLLSGFKTGISDTARDVHNEIDKRVENVARSVTDMFDPLADVPAKMDQMGDHFKETGDNFGKFLDDFHPAAPKVGLDKHSIQSFVDNEREFLHDLPKPSKENVLDRYSDSEPEHDDFKPSIEHNFPKKVLPEPVDYTKTDDFKDFKDLDDFPKETIKKVEEPLKPKTPEPAPKIEQPILHPEPVSKPVEPKLPEPVKEPVKTVPEPIKKQPEPAKAEIIKKDPVKSEEKSKIAPADAGAILRKIGIDAWFNPERLNPKVESLIYWRDPKKSGPVFGGVLAVLLALTYFSLISVVAYLSLIALTGTIAFRIYKNIVQAVQKTGDGHPFKDLLDMDVSLPQDKVREVVDVGIAHVNASFVELRRLFLVEDLVDSIKFGVLLWVLTYLGAWFNGMTLIIIAWVALFSLPKVYETNKTQIDANLALVRSKVADITAKVKAAIPIGKKGEEKKEQ